MPREPRDPVARLVRVDDAETPGYVLRAKEGEQKDNNLIWHVDEGLLTIDVPGPNIFRRSADIRLSNPDVWTFYNCDLDECDYAQYTIESETIVTGLESLSGVYDYSLFRKDDFTPYPVAALEAAIESGDICKLLEMKNTLIGWRVPAVGVTIDASLTITQLNYLQCGSHSASGGASVSSQAFYIHDFRTLPAGVPKLQVSGIYVRNWPFLQGRFAEQYAGPDGEDVEAAVIETFAPVWSVRTLAAVLGSLAGLGHRNSQNRLLNFLND
jgi:hypothetical protein